MINLIDPTAWSRKDVPRLERGELWGTEDVPGTDAMIANLGNFSTFCNYYYLFFVIFTTLML
jgi:hypothetical protein